MKQLAFASVVAAVVATAGVASAADLPRRAPVYKAPPVQVFSWTGCYVGGSAGWIGNDSSSTSNPVGSTFAVGPNTTSSDFDGSDFTAGAVWGCNKQINQFVIGLDSDFSWTGISDSVTASHAAAGGRTAYTQTITQDLDYFSTTRLRLGWAHDRWMVFAAGGLASGKVKSSYTDVDALGIRFSGSESDTRWGWTIGGGVEYALSQNWFLRGEYMYIDLGSEGYTSVSNTAGTGLWNTEVDTTVHVARAALTYRFTTAPSMYHWVTGGFRY